MRNAFAACAAAYDRANASSDGLLSQVGDNAGVARVARVNSPGGLTSVVLIRGASLYVASAERQSRTWSSWVDIFAAPLIEVSESRLQCTLHIPSACFLARFLVPLIPGSLLARRKTC